MKREQTCLVVCLLGWKGWCSGSREEEPRLGDEEEGRKGKRETTRARVKNGEYEFNECRGRSLRVCEV